MSVIPRVLYVDDDQDNCELMKYWIREICGCEISIAMDGREAMEKIASEFFDLFLLDYCLPDTTGVELCIKIRELYPKAPIAVYSALDREIDKNTAIAAGATAYLVKPEDLDQIRPFLKEHLSAAIISDTEQPSRTPLASTTSSRGVHRGRTRASGIV